jgi:PAS domain S-box-containing protein
MERNEINVLYIEDEPEIIRLVSRQLDTANDVEFNLISKQDITTAIEYLECKCVDDITDEIDVILLDLNLPNSRGIKTFLEVKKRSGTLPIVIMSAFEDIACKCVSLGAQDYLVKPDITSGLLIRALKYAIERNMLENRIKNVIHASYLGYHMFDYIDNKLIFVDFNPAAEKILNTDNSKFINKEITEVFPSLSLDVISHFKSVVESGVPWNNEIIPYGDESTRPAFFKMNAYTSSKNQLTITFEDITNNVFRDKQLRENEERYRNLVEATGVSIFGIQFSDDKITYANDSFCNFLGYTYTEVTNMTLEDILTEDSRVIYRQRTLSLKLGKRVSSNVEYSFVRKDGSISWMFVTCDFIEDSNTRVVGANVAAIDITQKKQDELYRKERIEETYSSLEEKIKAWNKELSESYIKTDEQLTLLDQEILLMSQKDEVI